MKKISLKSNPLNRLKIHNKMTKWYKNLSPTKRMPTYEVLPTFSSENSDESSDNEEDSVDEV